MRCKEVPKQFGGLDVLIAPDAEPVVASAAHTLMVEFLSAGSAKVPEEFELNYALYD